MTSAILLLVAQLAASAPVTLTVRVVEGRLQFRPGEIIPIELEFSSPIPEHFAVDGATYDRSGRLTIDEFHVAPLDAITDPMLDYFASVGGYIGGGLRGIGVLGGQPFVVKLDLNDWFRFDRPGTVRLSVRSRRVSDEASTSQTVVPVDSNAVTFEILPRDAAWEATELESARRMLDATRSWVDRRKGCRILRFLATDAAVTEMIRRYGTDTDSGCDFEYMAGLFGAPNREFVVRQMEDALRAPDQAVTAGYLRTLAVLSVYQAHPEFRPAQTRERKGTLNAGGELSRHVDLIDTAMAVYGEMLTAALPEKTDRARAITVAERAGMMTSSATSPPASSREQLATAFLALPPERQATLLDFQWSTIASAAMIPVLRTLVEHPPNGPPSIADLALRRLYDLAPSDARPLILREIQHPRPGATLKTLGRLPDPELPELDDVLAANFEAGRELATKGDFGGEGIRAELLHRNASRRVADRVLESATGRLARMVCRSQVAVFAYFLRVDDGIGKMLLDRAMESRGSRGCRTNLVQVAELQSTPIVEARAVADLDDPNPDMVIAAIETLGRYGSTAVRAPLRLAFERWHRTWEGRAVDLQFSCRRRRVNTRRHHGGRDSVCSHGGRARRTTWSPKSRSSPTTTTRGCSSQSPCDLNSVVRFQRASCGRRGASGIGASGRSREQATWRSPKHARSCTEPPRRLLLRRDAALSGARLQTSLRDAHADAVRHAIAVGRRRAEETLNVQLVGHCGAGERKGDGRPVRCYNNVGRGERTLRRARQWEGYC